tara:strand:- start:27 stop:437 length:411 start_codon:yes stop_codon:yes gene_type:complete
MNKKVLIVSANYYKDISKDLISDTQLLLKRFKIKNDLVIVPGVFEIPVILSKNIKKYDGFIALGCVIKGETPHFDFISKTTFEGLMLLSIKHKKPIGNGIITSLNKEQAEQRSSTNSDQGKGKEAAKAVISILSLK